MITTGFDARSQPMQTQTLQKLSVLYTDKVDPWCNI